MRFRRVIAAFAFVAASALTLTACHAASGSYECNDPTNVNDCIFVPSTPSPAALAYCADPSGQSPQQLYPIPGLTIPAASLTEIVLADKPGTAYSGTGFFYIAFITTVSTEQQLANGAGSSTQTQTGMFTAITLSQVPSPSAAPTIANPLIVEAALVSSLPSGATFYVYLNDITTGPNPQCNSSGPIGSFATT